MGHRMLMSDNTTVVEYINRQGGTESLSLSADFLNSVNLGYHVVCQVYTAYILIAEEEM